MATYRYIVADMLTGAPLEELPLDCESFSQHIGGEVGSTSGKLALGSVRFDWRAATTERRTTLNILRDDHLVVWGGPIMKRHPVNNGDAVDLSAESWEGYLARRRIKSTLNYTTTDVFDIVRGIIAAIQAVPGGNVGMTVDAGLAGYAQTISYADYARVKVLDELKRLAEIAPNFEWYISVNRDPTTGIFRPHLNLAAPAFATDLPPIVAEFPGNVITYDYPEDGGRAANAVTGIGKGDGVSMLIDEEVDSLGELARGYPIYEDELSIKEEDNLARLQARTRTDLAVRLLDYVVPTVDLRGDIDPAFGSYPLGIACRLRATSLYHPATTADEPGLDLLRRVTGWTVKPSAAGRQEQVTLALTGALGKIRPPLDGKSFKRVLATLETRVRTLETAR
jgi:hypothetical protein